MSGGDGGIRGGADTHYVGDGGGGDVGGGVRMHLIRGSQPFLVNHAIKVAHGPSAGQICLPKCTPSPFGG